MRALYLSGRDISFAFNSFLFGESEAAKMTACA